MPAPAPSIPAPPSVAGLHSASTVPSRRALLAGALAGMGAWALGAAARVGQVRAADGEAVQVGGEYTAESVTKIATSAFSDAVIWGENTSNYGLAVKGSATNGTGVQGLSSSNGYGVHAFSDSGTGCYGASYYGKGVLGYSLEDIAVDATTSSNDKPCIRGWSYYDFTAVQGYSGQGLEPVAAKPKTGVYGYANQDSLAKGVWGHSPAGHAIQGTSESGWAGYFSGRLFVERYQEFKEINYPAAPGPNRLRLFARDNGSGKTQLCVRFATGAVRVLATQP